MLKAFNKLELIVALTGVSLGAFAFTDADLKQGELGENSTAKVPVILDMPTVYKISKLRAVKFN